MSEPPRDPVKYVERTMYLPFEYSAGDYVAIYLRSLKDKKILGSRCAKTGKVFVPPVMSSPASGAPCTELVEVEHRGVITTFCVVNIPVLGRDLELPYVCASVLLDGADVSIFALIQEVGVSDVRMGMRVEAVWKPDAERQGDHTDILHFRPSGEPDEQLDPLAGRG